MERVGETLVVRAQGFGRTELLFSPQGDGYVVRARNRSWGLAWWAAVPTLIAFVLAGLSDNQMNSSNVVAMLFQVAGLIALPTLGLLGLASLYNAKQLDRLEARLLRRFGSRQTQEFRDTLQALADKQDENRLNA